MSTPPPAPSTAPSAPRRRSRLWIVFGLALLVAAVAVTSFLLKRAGKKDTLVTVEKAETRSITQLVSATGKIQPEVEVKIAPEVAGEIIELPFREGDRVKKGDLIVSIKADTYRFLLEQREADLASARALDLDARVRLSKAEEDFRRIEKLFASQLVPDSELTAARTTFEAARASVDNTAAQIRRADGTLKQALDQLEKTTIFAPIDGTVSARSSEVGERVVATGQFTGTEVMRIADLANMEVRVNVNENDIVNVKTGDTARIAIDAYPRRTFNGVVKEIAATARTTGQNTQEEVTNFQVRVRIVEPGVQLRPGMSASVDIQTKTVANVVAVPTQAVTVRSREGNKTLEQVGDDRARAAAEKKGDGGATVVDETERRAAERADREALQRVVFRLEDGIARLVPVETGIADTTHTEIKSGLKAGDEIIVGSFSVITRTLTDGMKVAVENPQPAAAKP